MVIVVVVVVVVDMGKESLCISQLMEVTFDSDNATSMPMIESRC